MEAGRPRLAVDSGRRRQVNKCRLFKVDPNAPIWVTGIVAVMRRSLASARRRVVLGFSPHCIHGPAMSEWKKADTHQFGRAEKRGS